VTQTAPPPLFQASGSQYDGDAGSDDEEGGHVGRDEPADAVIAPADADNHLVFDHQRRQRERIGGLVVVNHLYVPQGATRFRMDRDEPRIVRRQKERVAQYRKDAVVGATADNRIRRWNVLVDPKDPALSRRAPRRR
jgi:hypothetical protein